MLEFENVVIRSGSFTLTVENQIADCHSLGIMGPSGSGKSTLLSAICGFTPLQSGAIRFQGEKISGKAPSERPVSMIFQSHNLFPAMTVAQNIALGHHQPSHTIEEISRSLGIGELLKRFPREISGGQVARVAIARVLLQDKSLVLLDEPFAALGPKQVRELNQLIRESMLRLGKMVILVDHSPENLKNYCDEMIWVDHNHVNAACETKSFFENPSLDVKNYL